MSNKHEVPSDEEVVSALHKLGGHADAVRLCQQLIDAGHPRLESQLAIQRAAERGKIMVNRDWTLATAAVAA